MYVYVYVYIHVCAHAYIDIYLYNTRFICMYRSPHQYPSTTRSVAHRATAVSFSNMRASPSVGLQGARLASSEPLGRASRLPTAKLACGAATGPCATAARSARNERPGDPCRTTLGKAHWPLRRTYSGRRSRMPNTSDFNRRESASCCAAVEPTPDTNQRNRCLSEGKSRPAGTVT